MGHTSISISSMLSQLVPCSGAAGCQLLYQLHDVPSSAVLSGTPLLFNESCKAAAAYPGAHVQSSVVGYHLATLVAAVTAEASSSPLACVRMHSRVLALAWLPPAEQQLDLRGNALLAVLHELSREAAGSVVHSGFLLLQLRLHQLRLLLFCHLSCDLHYGTAHPLAMPQSLHLQRS